jgi:hypothetical protein
MGDNSEVYNNTIEYEGEIDGHGFMFGGDPGDLRNFTIHDNTAKHLSFGFLFHGNANNSIMYNNTAIDVSVGTYIITNPKNNRLYNMTYINSTYGVHFYSSASYTIQESPSNNTVDGVIATNVTYPIYFTGVNLTNGNLVKNVIVDGGVLKLIDSYNAFVENAVGFENITVEGSWSNLTLTNFSYTDSEIVASGNLTRKWYLNLGSIQESVLINLTYENGTEIYSNTTASGLMSFPVQTLTAYINEGGTATNETYIITASKSGYITNTTTFNLTDNTILNFTLVEEPATPS